MNQEQKISWFFFDPNNKTVLLHRRDHRTRESSNMWDCFGGKIEEGETPKKALVRELHEELGIMIPECEAIKLINNENKYIYYIYFCDWLTQVIKLGEGAGFCWFSLENALNLGDITNEAKNILGKFKDNMNETNKKLTEGGIKTKNKIFSIILRTSLILALSSILAFYLSNLLEFNFRFQPLLKDNKILIPLLDSNTNYSVLNNFFYHNVLGFLKYRTTMSNNVKTIIGGDEKDYEHEVELFVKMNNPQGNEIKINYGESKDIFNGVKRDVLIATIKDMTYRTNINLKPEVLSDNNANIYLNKKIEGYIESTTKLTISSKIMLYFLTLIPVIAMIIWLKNFLQFIYYGKKYFKT